MVWKNGFVPFDPISKEKHIPHTKLYKKIQNKVNNTLVCDTKLKKYIKDAVKLLKMNIDMKKIDLLFDKYNNKSIKDFFKKFMKIYENTCAIFEIVYRKISKELKMDIEGLYGISYFLKLK